MPTEKQQRKRNALIGGSIAGIGGSAAGMYVGSAFNDKDTINVLRSAKKQTTKAGKEFFSSLTPSDQKAFKHARVKAHVKNPVASSRLMVNNLKRGAKLRKGTLVGLGTGVGLGAIQALDSYNRPIRKAFRTTGNKGDKRNVKYVTVAGLGGLAGRHYGYKAAGGTKAVRQALDGIAPKAMELGEKRTQQIWDAYENQNSKALRGHVFESFKEQRRLIGSTKPYRIMRRSGRVGALTAAGSYAAYRQTDKSKAKRGISKSERAAMTYSAFGVEHNVSKAMTGTTGDKRNTKYAAIGGASALAGSRLGQRLATGSSSNYRAAKIRAFNGAFNVTSNGGKISAGIKAGNAAAGSRYVKGGRIGALVGGATAVGAYGMHRQKQPTGITKALMPIAPAKPAPGKPTATPIGGASTGAQMSAARRSPVATSNLTTPVKKPAQMPMAKSAFGVDHDEITKRMMECVECGKKANCDKAGCCKDCGRVEKAFSLAPIKAGFNAASKTTGMKLGQVAGKYAPKSPTAAKFATAAMRNPTQMGRRVLGGTAGVAGLGAGASVMKPNKKY